MTDTVKSLLERLAALFQSGTQEEQTTPPEELKVLTLTDNSGFETAGKSKNKYKKKAKPHHRQSKRKAKPHHQPRKKKENTKLYYDTVDEYFNNVSESTLEELLMETDVIPVTLDTGAIDRNARVFGFELDITKKIIENTVPPDQRSFRKLPFAPNLVVYIGSGSLSHTIIAVPCKVTKLSACEGSPMMTRVSMEIEVFPWVATSDIKVSGSSNVFIVPGNTPVFRVGEAMMNIGELPSTSIQHKLIKGKEPLDPLPLRLGFRLDSPDDPVFFDNENLNEEQKKVVEHAFTNQVTVVQGPPGTGKTSMIVSLIQKLVDRGERPIVVAAASNVAVDNIVEKLMVETEGTDLKFWRVVSSAKEAAYGKSHKLAPKLSHLKEVELLDDEFKRIREMLQDSKRASGVDPEQYRRYCGARKRVFAEAFRGPM